MNIKNIINNNIIINNLKSINNNKNKYEDIIDIYNKIYTIIIIREFIIIRI